MTDEFRGSGSAVKSPPLSSVQTAKPTRHWTERGCIGCRARSVCLAGRFESKAQRLGTTTVRQRRSITPDYVLYRAGTPYRTLYAVRSGTLKSTLNSYDGREQVTGFHFPGELIGLDGLHSGVHTLNVQSIGPSRICKVDFDELERLGQRDPTIQREVNRVFGAEIVREQNQMILLGQMNANQRLAAFLLEVSRRTTRSDGTPTAISLSMPRRDIASFLGMTHETVSRSLSQLRAMRLIAVENRRIEVQDPVAMLAMLSA